MTLLAQLESYFARVMAFTPKPNKPTDEGLAVDEITTDGLLIGNADLAEPTYEPPGEPEKVPALVDFPKVEAFRERD